MGVLKAQPSSLSGESSLASTADKGSHVVSSKSEDIKRKKRLVKAYQIFSDPGVENKVQPTHDDIEGAFSQLFGGGRFSSVIGTVDLETLIVDFQSGDEHSDSSSAKEIAAKVSCLGWLLDFMFNTLFIFIEVHQERATGR